MSDSDQDLLHRYLRERDQSAFRMLVERHLAFVHGVARRVTGNAAMAEDVAQQVFVRMARGAGGIPRDLTLAAWLHRVTRHLAIDLIRSESRRRTREARFESSTAMTFERCACGG